MQPPLDNATYSDSPGFVSDLLELVKVRIAVMVTLSAVVGFVLGAPSQVYHLVHLFLATFLTAAGAGALNQYVEREADGRMRRTADRPLPAGRLNPDLALHIGLLLTAVGVLYLVLALNLLTAVVGAVTTGVYILVYTPLKTRSPHNTAVGAISGALPPVGGWAAATGNLGGEALALFSILFVWQFPHFYAIAWMYREDYSRGGYRMLSGEDPSGDRTAHQMVLYSLVLLSCSLMPALMGLSGPIYFGAAILLGSMVLFKSLAFAKARTDLRARNLLRATLIYLPVLWAVMVWDRI
ncbi:MAG: heme o synthase [bacterium]|nr:heme o synthase [bacterium]